MTDKTVMWAIKRPWNDELCGWTVERLRKDAIGEFLLTYSDTWKYWYRQGFRAVRVRIEEIKDE